MGIPHYHPCTGDCPNGLTAGRVAQSGGRVDVITAEGDHLYWSTHCRHGNHAACSATEIHGSRGGYEVTVDRRPACCKLCLAPCRCGCHEGGTEWAPGAGVERIKREMPHLIPDEISDEDLRKAAEIIEAAEAERRAFPPMVVTTRPPTWAEVEAFTAAFKEALNQPLEILPSAKPTRAEIRAAVFAALRAALGDLRGIDVGRPHYGGQVEAFRRADVERWLNDVEASG